MSMLSDPSPGADGGKIGGGEIDELLRGQDSGLLRVSEQLSREQLLSVCTRVVSLVESLHPRILEFQRKSDLHIEVKPDGSRVTEADKWVSEQLITVLPQIAPELFAAPVQSEESLVPYLERKSWDRFWITDPIDGTEGFIRGSDAFAVSIALVDKDRPVLAVISLPAQGRLYYGVKDGGAFRKDENGVLDLSSIKRQPTPQVTVEQLPPEGVYEKLVVSYLEERGITGSQVKVESGASCFKFTQVLDGTFDIMPHPYPTHEWDIAAGDLLIQEAGMQFVDATTQDLVRYNSPSYYMNIPGFFAGR